MSGSLIFQRCAITTLEKPGQKGQAIGFTKRRGQATREPTFKTPKETRRVIKLNKFSWQLKGYSMKVGNNDHYTYRVTWSEDDQEFVGLCAEFPSLSWLASSQEGALRGVRSVVAHVIVDMKKNRESIPEPLARRSFSGKFMVRVPPEIHRRLVVEAAESGVSLNRLASAKLSH